jgi:hypothetical protein
MEKPHPITSICLVYVVLTKIERLINKHLWGMVTGFSQWGIILLGGRLDG